MLVNLPGQTTSVSLPPAIIVALALVVIASLLALIISILITRRIRAIGEDGRPTTDDRRTTED